jgi:solute carrier family 25 folate transporter 32
MMSSTKKSMVEMTEPDQSILMFTKEQSSMFASLIAGFGSGTLSSIACAPLDLVRTRMQVAGELRRGATNTTSKLAKVPNPSLVQSFRDIIAVEGFSGCFRGLGPTLLTVPTFWSLYFPLYEVLKKDLHQRGVGRDVSSSSSANSGCGDESLDRVPSLVHMTAAIMAGAWADFFCNPMFIVRTRMQTEALHYMEMPIEERKPHGIIQTVKNLYKEGGIAIFWRGFTASLLGLSHVAIQFPAYEFLKAEARERSTTNQESAFDLLLASGISKMLATSLTYPHEVVRSRMMDSRGLHGEQLSLRQAVTRIIRKEGFGALYTGIHVSLVRVVPNCCITFMTYELFLRWAKSKI